MNTVMMVEAGALTLLLVVAGGFVVWRLMAATIHFLEVPPERLACVFLGACAALQSIPGAVRATAAQVWQQGRAKYERSMQALERVATW